MNDTEHLSGYIQETAPDSIEAESDALAETETYTWEVWRRREAGDALSSRAVYEVCGELDSESNYRPWREWSKADERAALERIATLGDGPGDYALFRGDRVHLVSIVAETVYRLADES